jgi:hypothetical protein
MDPSLENTCSENCCNVENCCTLTDSCTLTDVISEPNSDPFSYLLQVDPLIDHDTFLDIEIPQFPVKINVNNDEELPSSTIVEDEMPSFNIIKDECLPPPPPKNLSYDEMQNVMHDIEETVNFTSMSESMHALNNPDILFSRIQSAFDTFKEKTGRQMTYSEMRYMMG